MHTDLDPLKHIHIGWAEDDRFCVSTTERESVIRCVDKRYLTVDRSTFESIFTGMKIHDDLPIIVVDMNVGRSNVVSRNLDIFVEVNGSIVGVKYPSCANTRTSTCLLYTSDAADE